MKIRYVALLRGINVSGHKQVKMNQLRAVCIDIGFGNVRTYIQSGNVIFESAASSEKTLVGKVKSAILKEFGFSVPVLVFPASQLKRVLQQNPYLKEKGVDLSKLHVAFLSAVPSKTALANLANVKAGRDEFQCIDTLVYLHCPNGYGTTKLSNTAIEKAFGIEATTRNWKTVNQLYQMAED